MIMKYLVAFIYFGALIYCVTAYARRAASIRYKRKKLSLQHHCQPIHRKYPHRDPFFCGLDIFIENGVAAYQHRFLETITERHHRIGETFQQNLLGQNGIMTTDPEIIKAVLSTRFRDYSLGSERKKALEPLLGKGIFSSDGEAWSHSRALLRPQFSRSQLVDFSMLERHVLKLIELVSASEMVDMQEHLFRFTMDTATEFLFGESTNCLTRDSVTNQDAKDLRNDSLSTFADSIQQAQDRIFLHMALGRLAVLTPDTRFRQHVRRVHDFIDSYVTRALTEYEIARNDKSKVDGETDKEPYVFLKALVRDTQDPKRIRDELLNILIAGRDTTASFISNIFLMLAKHPSVWAKLRAEIAFLQQQPPTFDQLQQCKFLKDILNETLRLYPPVPVNSRVANCDTVLPHGGGPDGRSPVLITEGTPVVYNVYALHRREDIYGAHVHSFRPERWEKLRLSWEFLPFSGGPRICIGQQFAITEASYVVIRFLQTFRTMETLDSRPWEEKIGLTTSNLHGLKVSFTRI